MRRPLLSLAIAVSLFASLMSGTARAQQASGIAGTVRDSSGGVLPGVTVEAASPALIERVRVALSDGEQRYNIVDLRPGPYVVTFTLPGFRSGGEKHRPDGRLHRHGERGSAGRHARRDDHGDRRYAARRHPERAEADGRDDETLDVLPTRTRTRTRWSP